jgi:hypothetical protein
MMPNTHFSTRWRFLPPFFFLFGALWLFVWLLVRLFVWRALLFVPLAALPVALPVVLLVVLLVEFPVVEELLCAVRSVLLCAVRGCRVAGPLACECARRLYEDMVSTVTVGPEQTFGLNATICP